MPKPISQYALASVTGRDDVGARVGAAGQAAGEPRGGEAAARRAAVADRGEVGLAHVDAVLGQHHRRAVQRLVHERGDRRPAGGRHVAARPPRAPGRPPCARPSRASGRGARRRAGRAPAACRPRRRARASTSPSAAEEARPSRPGRAERAAHARRDGAGTTRTPSISASVSPFQPISSRTSTAGSAGRAGRRDRPAPRGSRSDQTSIGPCLARVRRQLEAARLPVRGDDRQHDPVELGQAVHEQVAPRAHAADHVRVRALGGQQDPRAGPGARPAAARAPAQRGELKRRARP